MALANGKLNPDLEQDRSRVEPQLSERARQAGLYDVRRTIGGDDPIDGAGIGGGHPQKRQCDEQSLRDHPPLRRPVGAARQKTGSQRSDTDTCEDDRQQQCKYRAESAQQDREMAEPHDFHAHRCKTGEGKRDAG
jgi:hypothetical protein